MKVSMVLEGVIFRSLSFKLYFLLAILLIISFAGIMYFNITSYTKHINESVMHSAIQASDIIKRSTRYSMLKNDREHLQQIMTTIGHEEGVEGVRIYNKPGQISFSDDLNEVGTTVDIDAEQCFVCHKNVPPLERLDTPNRIRVIKSSQGYRVLGLINPIENEPACYKGPCHDHSPQDKLLGLLDVKLSLKSVDEEIDKTQRQMILYSSLMIVITVLFFGGFIYKLVHIPVRKLAKGTKEVANLNLDYTIDFKSNDEMGELAKSFNQMTQQLKASNEANQEWSAILERKVKEKTEELNKAQAHLILVEKIASLGKLSAIVAHEINNPLSGILTYASLCLKILQAPAPSVNTGEPMIKYLTVIRDEAKRCGEIVKNLLVFAKKDFGKWSEESLHKIIYNSIRLVKHNMDLKEISLVEDLAEGDDRIFCDSSGIQQIFVALFINAIEAMSKGGRITVRTRFLDHGYIEIVVSDTGSGIPEELLPKIFEPFFSTKESTGLGLAVVYRIIQQHEGRVKVSSKPDEGTTFTIHLPRSPEKIEEQLQISTNRFEPQS